MPINSAPQEPRLEPEEITILRSWAEAIAVLACAPEQLDRIIANADDGAEWRAGLALGGWSAPLTDTFGSIRTLLASDSPAHVEQPLDRALAPFSAAGDGMVCLLWPGRLDLE